MDTEDLKNLIDGSFSSSGKAMPLHAVQRQLEMEGIDLPPLHVRVLAEHGGLSAFGGYFRLFGFGDTAATSALAWNHPETWKFAWGTRVDAFFCFGETGWGDQYAYRMSELGPGRDPSVYFLEGITMEPEPLARTFYEFLAADFCRNAKQPYDLLITEARKRVGDLRPDEHIVYQPSILLGGPEAPENICKLPAVAAMTVNGDLWSQLRSQRPSQSVRELVVQKDEQGRPRLRVVWDEV